MATPNTKRNIDANKDDLYQTQPLATQAAIKAGVFDGVHFAYDPCNGLGGITEILEDNQISCLTSDKIDYGVGDKIVDFLDPSYTPNMNGIGAIVFNPPYKLTSEFMDKAVSSCDKVIMFNRISFLETVKRVEKFISKEWNLTDVYIHAYRVGCKKGLEEEKYANAVMYAWYVFDKNNIKPHPVIHWITEK